MHLSCSKLTTELIFFAPSCCVNFEVLICDWVLLMCEPRGEPYEPMAASHASQEASHASHDCESACESHSYWKPTVLKLVQLWKQFLTGPFTIRTHKWPPPNVSGFIAQLVRASHRNREVTGFRLLYAIAKIAFITAKIIASLDFIYAVHIWFLSYTISSLIHFSRDH